MATCCPVCGFVAFVCWAVLVGTDVVHTDEKESYGNKMEKTFLNSFFNNRCDYVDSRHCCNFTGLKDGRF